MKSLGFRSAFLFLLFAFHFSFSQQVVIQGSAESYKGNTISAYSYKDLITYTPQIVASGKISSEGKFELRLPNINTSRYLYLNIENMNASIYVSPGKTYHVIFPPPDSIHYQNPYVSHIVDLTFLVTDSGKCHCADDSLDLSFLIRNSDDINNLIIDYNNQFDIFWRKYYTYFVRKQANAVLDSFHNSMRKRYKVIKNPYFSGFLDYTIAEIDISIMEGEKTLGNKYLKGKPVLYHNYEYMKFFNDYFRDYLSLLALKYVKKDDKVNRFINSADYTDLMEALRINPFLRDNDSLCELVMLKGLYELYYAGDNDENAIKTLLKTIVTISKIDEDKLIAQDILNSFSEMVGGVAAPEFTLKDAQGDATSIIDFRGKYTYICFFKSTSESCTGELDVIAALHKQYGKKINFVCISEDDNYADLKKYLEDNKMFNWTFLFDEGHRTLQQYEVKSLPEFFLINPKGMFYKSPAESPSHGIQMIFDELLSHKKYK
jgi:peroxiredoxin